MVVVYCFHYSFIMLARLTSIVLDLHYPSYYPFIEVRTGYRIQTQGWIQDTNKGVDSV